MPRARPAPRAGFDLDLSLLPYTLAEVGCGLLVAISFRFVLAAGEKFELLRANPLDEMALATPAMVGERLLLRTESKLYSIRRAK